MHRIIDGKNLDFQIPSPSQPATHLIASNIFGNRQQQTCQSLDNCFKNDVEALLKQYMQQPLTATELRTLTVFPHRST